MQVKLPIYMDHHASTPIDPAVLKAMMPYFTENYGNPGAYHIFGQKAALAIENAREKTAELINADPAEIVFTSGGTESDNLAIKGIVETLERRGKHIITSSIEHHAVFNVCREMEEHGLKVSYLPVDKYGNINLQHLKEAIRKDTILISLMMANNEIGTQYPIDEIGDIARENNIFFHTDAVQAAGYMPINVRNMPIDLLSLSSHKLYGPKGVGALYINRDLPFKLKAQMDGGGQERNRRSGTHNVPGIVGMGEACSITREKLSKAGEISNLRDEMWELFQKSISGVELHGNQYFRLPNNLNIFIPGVNTTDLVRMCGNKIALSTGSTCNAFQREPSHVIAALGFSMNRSFSTLRIGLGRSNTREEIIFAVDFIAKQVSMLRGE
jgi:cysteine desulfurase